MSAEWIKDWRSLKLAFDRAQIIADAEKHRKSCKG
jgi:hypothetical protein